MTGKEIEDAIAFHRHKCPAMPLGFRAAQAAMKVLGVDRAQDKKLYVIAETGKGHAINGNVDWHTGLILAIAAVAGGLLGSRISISTDK